MEDLIGFLIFIAIVAASIIGKIKTERKAATEREQRPSKPVSLDELPEATRRMLFGDGEGEIIVAKPKQGGPAAAPAPGEWRRVEETPPRPVPARRVAYEQPRPAAPQPQQPPRQQPVMQAPVQQRQQARQAPQRAAQPAQRRAQEHARPQPRQAQQPVRPVQASAPAPARQARRTSGRGLMSVLQSRNGLAQGILLHEILGPPKAFDN